MDSEDKWKAFETEYLDAPNLDHGLDVAPPTSSYAPSDSEPLSEEPGSSVMGFDEELGLPGHRGERRGVKRLLISSGLEEGQRECRSILKKLQSSGIRKGWCILCTLKSTKVGGYIQVSTEGTNKVAVLQDVLLWSDGRFSSDTEQCSHLCGQPACLVAAHVVSESPVANNSRKNCLVWHNCGHGECPKKVLVCQHEPLCVKYCEGFSSMEDLVSRGICYRVTGLDPVGR